LAARLLFFYLSWVAKNMALEVKGVIKFYGAFSVSLDLSVDKGETLALVGPSGSGKTTALNIISGISAPEEGKIIVDNEDISALPSWKRNISVVFQDLALFPHLDVGGNIAYGLFVRKVPRKERRKVIEETLNTVRLSGYASRRVHTLSGGEKQRVAIARALASRPSALLLDEPFSSLDAPLRKDMRREFLDIRSRSDAPCVFVTHDREEAAIVADRVALLAGGRIIETAAVREIFFAPKTEFAARFFGAGQVLPCRVMEKLKTGYEISSPVGVLTVTVPSEFDNEAPKIFIPHDAISFFDPENAGWKVVKAKVIGFLFEGSKITVKLRLPLPPWELSQSQREKEDSNFKLELEVSPRIKVPENGSDISIWIDQSLVRFVK
jgi:ABC-type Fe3+/spermidine/putrescine transport system ATPase subunit